jgi:hypothetical protein
MIGARREWAPGVQIRLTKSFGLGRRDYGNAPPRWRHCPGADDPCPFFCLFRPSLAFAWHGGPATPFSGLRSAKHHRLAWRAPLLFFSLLTTIIVIIIFFLLRLAYSIYLHDTNDGGLEDDGRVAVAGGVKYALFAWLKIHGGKYCSLICYEIKTVIVG